MWNATGALSSTAAQVVAALNADPAASAILWQYTAPLISTQSHSPLSGMRGRSWTVRPAAR